MSHSAALDLFDLVRYNDWANDRLVKAIRTLSSDAQSTPITSSFGTLRETLAHIVSAEWIWLRRWKGESPSGSPAWLAADSVGQLVQRLDDVRRERTAYLSDLEESDFARSIEYRNLKGQSFTNSLADLIRHVVNHSTYHRGQAATQLRQLGQVPPSTDLILYLRETDLGS